MMESSGDILINLVLNSLNYSDFYHTILSIERQIGIGYRKIYLNLVKENKYLGDDLDCFKDEIYNNGYTKYPEYKNQKFRYILDIKNGDIISHDFLYKAIRLLENKKYSVICPEYSIGFSKEKPEAEVFNSVYLSRVYLLDNDKLNSGDVDFLFLKDSCVIFYSDENYKPYLIPDRVIFNIKNTKKIKYKKDTPINVYNKLNLFLKNISLRLCRKSPFLLSVRNYIAYRYLRVLEKNNSTHFYISEVLNRNISRLSEIDVRLSTFNRRKFTMSNTMLGENIYNNSISEYVNMVNEIKDNYKYVLVLPWLIEGGVDLFAINYCNTISEIYPEERILIITTNYFKNSKINEIKKLNANIDFLELNNFIHNNIDRDLNLKYLLISILSKINFKYLHIMMSKVGYETVREIGQSLRAQGVKVIFSSYNYIEESDGRITGYSVDDLPNLYNPGDTITTDNSASRDLWINNFGIRERDILVHSQKFDKKNIKPKFKISARPRILWASHIRKEKNPQILPLIAKGVSDLADIECYGTFNPEEWETNSNPIINSVSNLKYRGSYSNFFRDIDISKYDLFLYTSKYDGTPNVIIEAIIAGLPIITSSIGGIPDLVGENAIKVLNPDNPEEFIEAIKFAINNFSKSRAKAVKLQDKIKEITSSDYFKNQVERMLK